MADKAPLAAAAGDGYVYEKLVARLEARIRCGEYPLESRIPSEQAMAVEFGVSRPTVKRALVELASRGIVETRPAVGTYVVRRPGLPGVIGCICPTLADPFMGDALRALEAALRARQCSLMVTESGADLQHEVSARDHLIANGVAGLLVCGGAASQWRELKASGVPVVWFGGVPDSEEVLRVMVDDEAGMRDLLAHLAGLGVRSIGYAEATSAGCQPLSDARSSAVRDLAPTFGLKLQAAHMVAEPGQGEAVGERLLTRFLAAGALPQAILCCDDWTAIGLLRQAERRGLQVPDELRVTGFDNLLVSRYLPIPLTTVDYPLAAMAEKAIDLLDGGSQGHAGTHAFPGRLIARASTCLGDQA